MKIDILEILFILFAPPSVPERLAKGGDEAIGLDYPAQD